MNHATIRFAKDADYPNFLPVYEKFLIDVDTSHPELETMGETLFIEYINQPKNFIILALDDDQVIGISEIGIKYRRFRDKTERIEVNSMYVLPEYQGKGIRSMIIDFIESFANQEAIERIYLNSGNNTPDAHRFYKKNGYEQYGVAFKKKLSI